MNKSEAAWAGLTQECERGVTGACALIGRSTQVEKPVPIMQSVTGPQQTRFVIQIPRDDWRFYIREDKTLIHLPAQVAVHPGSKHREALLEAFGLQTGKSYELIVLNEDGDLADRRSFQTLDLSKRRARIAVASCMDDRYQTEQALMWKQLVAQRPDAIFLIGDNVYVDRGRLTPNVDPEFIWRRYAETRGSLSLFVANPLIPVMAVWDDHDFGKNDGDRTWRFKKEAEAVFYNFFAQLNPMGEFERGPGVSSWWTAFGVHFAFLDDRSFRSPNRADLEDQTHFGVEQEQWLSEKLKVAKRPVFLISGDQFFGGYHAFESFEGSHPKRFAAQLEEWKKVKTPLVFLSGDRHLSEILKVPAERLGYPTFELTSSAIHAKVFKDALERSPAPQRVWAVAGQHNYLLLEIMRADRNYLQMDAQWFGQGSQLLFQKILTVRRP